MPGYYYLTGRFLDFFKISYPLIHYEFTIAKNQTSLHVHFLRGTNMSHFTCVILKIYANSRYV